MLELRNVVKHFHGPTEEVRAVDGVSLTVKRGEMVALHGPSGSGKTTLLLLIAALLKPEAGTIQFAGRDLGSFSQVEASDYLMRDVGFIHQRVMLMPHVSALENAAMHLVLSGMGMSEATAQVSPLLERMGLADRLEHWSEQLSGGERQRVAIARALAGNPRLVLADEPTGNLDSQRSRDVIETLRELAHNNGTGVLLVTHDQEAANIADRQMILRDGRLSEISSTVEPATEDGPAAPLPSTG